MQPKPNSDAHNQTPSDDITRDKINKHLSDINDTISEQDIKNINTTIPPSDTGVKENAEETPGSTSETKDEESKEEMPNVWDIMDI